MLIVACDEMAQHPVGWKMQMRELSLGAWAPHGFWNWTFHDGSTWAACGFNDTRLRPEAMIGWSAITCEIDREPVLGVYVADEYRSQGFGRVLVKALLNSEIHGIVRGSVIWASTGRWPAYFEIMREAGYRCETWA